MTVEKVLKRELDGSSTPKKKWLQLQDPDFGLERMSSQRLGPADDALVSDSTARQPLILVRYDTAGSRDSTALGLVQRAPNGNLAVSKIDKSRRKLGAWRTIAPDVEARCTT